MFRSASDNVEFKSERPHQLTVRTTTNESPQASLVWVPNLLPRLVLAIIRGIVFYGVALARESVVSRCAVWVLLIDLGGSLFCLSWL